MRGLWLGGILLVSVLAFFLFRPSGEQSSVRAVAITLPSETSPPVPSPPVADDTPAEAQRSLSEQPALPQSGPVIEAPRELTWEEPALSLQSRPPDVADLILAIRQRDLARVSSLLAQRVNPNAFVESEGLPALFEAVLVDDAAIISALLDAGARLRGRRLEQEGSFHTALSFAALHGKADAARVLIERGADVAGISCQQDYCGNVVTMAAAAGNDPMVRALLAGRTDDEIESLLRQTELGTQIRQALSGPRRLDEDSRAILSGASSRALLPLSAAARFGHVDVFRTLRSLGAEIDCPYSRNGFCFASKSPYRLARANGHSAITELIEAERAEVSALIAAIRGGDTDEAQRIVGLGVDVNLLAANGQTPLVAAAKSGDAAMVRLLLAAGANPDIGPWQGFEDPNPLHIAIRTQQNEIVQLLLAAGADVNASHGDEFNGSNPALAYAAFAGDVDLVRDLLERGATTSPLHCTNDVICDPYLEIAIVSGNLELVRVFIAAGEPVNGPLQSFRHMDGGLSTYALMSPLMIAVSHPDILAVLVNEFGADVSEKNGDGCTAVDYAVIGDHHESAEFLLAAGAVPDRNGCQRYQQAVQ